MKMTFKCEHFNEDEKESNQKMILTTDKQFLPDILVEFEHFLKGCGFNFDGHVDITEEDV
jgi:hypothetical protein